MVSQMAILVRQRAAISVIIAAVMLMSLAPMTAFADGEMTISVTANTSNAELSAGSEFSVEVNVTNNPGFAGLALNFEYDRNSLELVGFGRDGLIGRSYIPNVEGGAFAFFSGNNVNGDGLLFSANFRVRSDAASGDYSIGVTLKDGVSANLVNANTEPINAVFVADNVSVTGGSSTGGNNNGNNNGGNNGDSGGNTGTNDPGNTGTGDPDNGETNTGESNGQESNNSAHGSNNAARNGMTVVAKAADGSTYSFMLRDTDSGREYSLDEGQSWYAVPDDKIITTDDGTTISVDKKIDADFVVEELPLALMGGDTTRQPYYLPVIAVICLATCGIMLAVVYFQTKRRRAEQAKERLAKKQSR
jgi:hypothetical protein